MRPGRAGGGDGSAPLTTSEPYGGDAAQEGTPEPGATLVIGNDREIISFDPARQNSDLAATMVHDSLMRLTPGGGAEPYVAESMETGDGGTTWRMGLRAGVLFSDDTLPDAQPPNQGTLGMIVSPAAPARYGDDIGDHSVGAGPFVLANWARDNKMQPTRNPRYWQHGPPYPDGIEIRPLPDTESRYRTMANGDVDMINGGFNSELVRAFQNPDLRIHFAPGQRRRAEPRQLQLPVDDHETRGQGRQP